MKLPRILLYIIGGIMVLIGGSDMVHTNDVGDALGYVAALCLLVTGCFMIASAWKVEHR